MKIELDNEVLYMIKDVVMVEFLKDDLDTVFRVQKNSSTVEEIKYNKKHIKSYKTILKYYGVAYDWIYNITLISRAARTIRQVL